MPIKGGPKEAARMILELGAEGKKLLETIRKSDPQMAELIELNLPKNLKLMKISSLKS